MNECLLLRLILSTFFKAVNVCILILTIIFVPIQQEAKHDQEKLSAEEK